MYLAYAQESNVTGTDLFVKKVSQKKYQEVNLKELPG